MDSVKKPLVKIKLVEINSHLSCPLCKGYFIDATTISECLHSFCRSCIIKFLHENSYCPVCELLINKAKPNLKLDKTLQDIVYKLVPELFLNEMMRRQWFYRSYPELAAKVTPEEKGEDTERTIFNPRDTISLSIEYMSDDSTPGAIVMPQLIGKGADCNNKNTTHGLTDEEGNSVMRRFLQCPGMCRIDVLKKFIRNKYNVDTNQYYIDILYKRVPLPDLYTLIDIAYIYSWKRNEPMKLFFKITDINLVTDSFDYLIPPQVTQEVGKRTPRASKHNKIIKNNTLDLCPKNDLDNTIVGIKNSNSPTTPKISTISDCKTEHFEIKESNTNYTVSDVPKLCKSRETVPVSIPNTIGISNITKKDNTAFITQNQMRIRCGNVESATDKEDMYRIQKEAIEQFKKNEKRKEFTNVTLDRNNHLEIITKIQKVSNKSGLQIGIKITKQTFKKNELPNRLSESPVDVDQTSPDEKLAIPVKPLTSPTVHDTDIEKSNFLKSIELTAKHVIKAMVPQMLDLPKSPNKRKNSSPSKSKKCSKKPKKYVTIQPKAIQNPAVWQMVSNVNQNVSNLSKIVEQMTPNPSSTNSDLQALLYDSYKINIPSSLSVTVKNDKDTPTPTFQKPVQNYIEILKLPDLPSPAHIKPEPAHTKSEVKDESSPNTLLDKLNSDMSDDKVEVKQELKTPEVEGSPFPQMIFSSGSDSHIKTENANCNDKTSAVIPMQLTDDSDARETSSKLLHPRAPQTFQKMFEETLKQAESSSYTTTTTTTSKAVVDNVVQKTALNLSTNNSDSGIKRKITEIASKLYKKSKLEHDKTLISVPKSNPPLKDFDSYISQQKSNTQTISNLHSPKLGLNYTVSVTQDNPDSDLKIETKSPKKEVVLPRIPTLLPSPKKSTTVLNVPRKYNNSSSTDHKEVSSTSPVKLPKCNGSALPTLPEKDQLNPDQILEKYNIQNLAQLTANFNFPPNLLTSTASQLAALRHAMIYKHFEMQNHQNWLNMNPSPLVQYEKYVKGFSKSST